MQRRFAFATQLQIEERARNQLEDKVAERTAALEDVQAQLVQAGKLTALGEMSAGISHELNQPLTAIQSLADNADIFLDRGDLGEVRANVSKISKMAERMGRIIRNLRSFARNEAEEVTEVDLISVLQDALGIASGKLESSGTKVDLKTDLTEALVRGGRVRLSQVLVNLISNAVDAMEGQSDKRVEISVDDRSAQTRVTLKDNGPGLTDPKRAFDPFYTTKTVGEGLGLGLSISYGIIQSFGGDIDGNNHPDGGAVFTINLPKVKRGDLAA
jgi:two-component system C4-dicarboxylate transport sensor histidine kinase DctB